MMYPGHDVARQISGQPVMLHPIVDEDIPVGILDYDISLAEVFDVVFIELSGIQSDNDGSQFYMQISSDGGATFDGGASDYRFRCLSHGLGIGTQSGPSGLIGLTTVSGIGSAANETGSFTIIIPSPGVPGFKPIIMYGRHHNSSGNPATDQTYGIRDAGGLTIDAVRFKTGGGGLYQAGGHARAYGLRKP